MELSVRLQEPFRQIVEDFTATKWILKSNSFARNPALDLLTSLCMKVCVVFTVYVTLNIMFFDITW